MRLIFDLLLALRGDEGTTGVGIGMQEEVAIRVDDGLLVADIEDEPVDIVVAKGPDKGRPGRLERGRVDIGQHDHGPFRQELRGDRRADAAGTAGDEGHPALQRLRLRQALELGFLEHPVLDVEALLLRQPRILGDPGCSPHDVDGVNVELGREPRYNIAAIQRILPRFSASRPPALSPCIHPLNCARGLSP